MSFTSDEYNYYVNWVLFAVLGRLPEADALMTQFGGPIRGMAKKLVNLLGVPKRPVYRGMVPDPGEAGGDVLAADPRLTFVSWSEDKSVACWFADRDSQMSAFVRMLRPQISGWVAESWPDKARVLFHWSWASKFPLPGGQPVPLWLFADHHPEMIPAQVEWAMNTQKEVILRQDGKPLRVKPHAQAGCPPTAELDARLTFRNPQLAPRYLAELWTDVQEIARWIRFDHPEQTRGPIVYFTREQAIHVAYRGKGEKEGETAERWFERWKGKLRDNMPGTLLPGDPSVAYHVGAQGTLALYGLDERAFAERGSATLEEASAGKSAAAKRRARTVAYERVVSHFGVGPEVPLAWVEQGAPHHATKRGPLFNIDELRLWVARKGLPLPPMHRQRTLTTRQLAQTLGAPTTTILRWKQQDGLPASRVTGKGTRKGERLRYSLPEVTEWLVQTGRDPYMDTGGGGPSSVERMATSEDVTREFGINQATLMYWRKTAGAPFTDLRDLRKVDPAAADVIRETIPDRVRYLYNLEELHEWLAEEQKARPKLGGGAGVRLPTGRVAPRLRDVLRHLNVNQQEFAEMLGIGFDALRGYIQTSNKPVATAPKAVLDKAEELFRTVAPRTIKHVKQTSATKEEIEDALKRSGGVRERAAKLLGIGHSSLGKLADRYGVSYAEPTKALALSGISRDDIRREMEATRDTTGRFQLVPAARALGVSGGQSLWRLIREFGMEAEFEERRARGKTPGKVELKAALRKSKGSYELAAAGLGVHPETVRRSVVQYQLKGYVKERRSAARRQEIKKALKNSGGSLLGAANVLGLAVESASAAVKRHGLSEFQTSPNPGESW